MGDAAKREREGCGSVVDGRLPQQGWYGKGTSAVHFTVEG
jgi:hypothetical protein